jgi:hypothetical protein
MNESEMIVLWAGADPDLEVKFNQEIKKRRLAEQQKQERP